MDIGSEFWSKPAPQILEELKTAETGLSSAEAKKRLQIYGCNTLKAKGRDNAILLFLAQFKSPIILILLIATMLSIYTGDDVDAAIILTIVLISGILGFWQEYSAGEATAKLLELVQIKTSVIRDF